ncbi:MAG TPA: methyltransferase domain-containing protein [Stellaceae bacterium]|nr:methyltransferase domain-containing protein [Stellaceae bacterium]
MKQRELDIIRRAFAKQVMAAATADHTGVEAGFATVRREAFLRPGPWRVLRWGRGYVPTPSDDPVYLLTDDVVAILPERHINNGQPSLHAWLMASAAPQPGEHVVHIGAGVGYYTAILAEAVGPTGRVSAIEFDPGLAERARANLSAWSHVRVEQGDGSVAAFDTADVIYVNAGATRPAERWLDGLSEGGRLILPLTTDQGFIAGSSVSPAQLGFDRRGAVFLIERHGGDYRAKWLSPVAIFPCEGMRDAASEAALAAAFAKGGWRDVTRLYRGDDPPAENCWVRAPGWSLAYR